MDRRPKVLNFESAKCFINNKQLLGISVLDSRERE